MANMGRATSSWPPGVHGHVRPRSHSNDCHRGGEAAVAPVGNWKVRIVLAPAEPVPADGPSGAATLRQRIERWLDAEGLRSEVTRIEERSADHALALTCSSKCKRRLRAAFPDLAIRDDDWGLETPT